MPSIDPATLPHQVREQLARFSHNSPSMLSDCAGVSPRVAQLATSFPLLFVMLASCCGPADRRTLAIRYAVEGRPLNDVAGALSLPICFRRLPPEACAERIRFFAWSEESSNRLRPYLPKDPILAQRWLHLVTFAARLGDESIAIWFASRHEFLDAARVHFDHLRPLLLFAWASRHRPGMLGYCIPWSEKMKARNAANNCVNWMSYFGRAITLGPDGVTDPWIEASTYDGLDIVPLTTIEAIAGEAHAMENCLIDYATYVADDASRLFSIRADGHRIATMEVTRDAIGRFILEDIEGPEHTQVTPGLIIAMTRFLKSQKRRPLTPCPDPLDAAGPHLQRLISPYRNAVHAEERAAIGKWDWRNLAADAKYLSHAIGSAWEAREPQFPNREGRRNVVEVEMRRRRTRQE